jgi:hypothetical protein
VKDCLGTDSKWKKSGNRTRGRKWFNMQTLREKSYSISSISLRHKSENMSLAPSSPTTYLEYENLGDILKAILFALESPLGSSPLLYHTKSANKDVFCRIWYSHSSHQLYPATQHKEPPKKWIELKRLTGEYNFVDKIGNDAKSLYIPKLELEKSTFNFPTGN